MVAGEASGDMLGASLIQAIKQRCPDAQFAGIGGPRMQAQGFLSMVPQERLAVRGYLEVIKRLPELLGIRRRLVKTLRKERPDVFIGIDAPDFNLTIEGKMRRAGIASVHYVSPSVWAWRPERVMHIGQLVDRVLCLFPMEPPIYQQAGVPVTFVGHPLASEIPLVPDRDAMREQLGIAKDVPVFALLPGSRVSELDFMTPVYLVAARRILAELPDARFLVPLATQATWDCFQSQLSEQLARDLPIDLLRGHAQMAMIASDVVLVTSGTATLEVALTKRPMVISYRVSALTYRIVKRKLKLPYVGLPNILLGEKLVPELLQDDATPDKLADELLRIYRDKDYQARLAQRFTALHRELHLDSAGLAADAILEMADHGCKSKS